jgi:hypothetical protein
MIGGRPSYRGYFIEVRWVVDHWIFIIYDIRGEEVDRYLDLDEVKSTIDEWQNAP